MQGEMKECRADILAKREAKKMAKKSKKDNKPLISGIVCAMHSVINLSPAVFAIANIYFIFENTHSQKYVVGQNELNLSTQLLIIMQNHYRIDLFKINVNFKPLETVVYV